MLTVDYDRLGAEPGDLVLDMGCGAGRHAFETVRRGCRIVALDQNLEELVDVRNTFAAMINAGELAADVEGQPVSADALKLPFSNETFDRIICSEVLEHIPNDKGAIDELVRVLRPGGSIAITVPAWMAEKICWRLNDEYHAPKAVGGHVRIYRKSELRSKINSAGLQPKGWDKAHSLHSPYWWLKCAVGPTNSHNRLVRAYHKFLVWDIVKRPLITRLLDRLLNPLIGKSVVLYATKPDTDKRNAA
ncbi:MAG: class I SAM-dependent methyltransferase [Acidimicrobiales bacterium]|jgi:SAM-dependent methyltransferase|nr:class I SAM-dependent methyltransferase [Acidimicrobiales bacterium]MDP6902488.1 class I SAM-dependent methyltransferase [Acidimicrobiales bacterium]HJL99554.1 class I SAM-dependent methyltransferase [Acidimicrobiales bacterium]